MIHFKQHCLYFFPLPHGHGSLRPTFVAKRNIERFPDDFIFQITESEWESLRSQNAILENNRGNCPQNNPACRKNSKKYIFEYISYGLIFKNTQQIFKIHKQISKKDIKTMITKIIGSFGGLKKRCSGFAIWGRSCFFS